MKSHNSHKSNKTSTNLENTKLTVDKWLENLTLQLQFIEDKQAKIYYYKIGYTWFTEVSKSEYITQIIYWSEFMSKGRWCLSY